MEKRKGREGDRGERRIEKEREREGASMHVQCMSPCADLLLT